MPEAVATLEVSDSAEVSQENKLSENLAASTEEVPNTSEAPQESVVPEAIESTVIQPDVANTEQSVDVPINAEGNEMKKKWI